jgi:thioredoxin 1
MPGGGSAMSAQYVELSDGNYEAETRRGVTLALFWDPWEQGCQREWKIIEKASVLFGERLRIGRCSVEQAPHLFERLTVRSIPTTLLLKDGKEEERLVGLRHKGRLIAHLKKYLK